MPKRYCGPSPFNGRMARRECQRCFNGSTLRLKMFLSSHSLFRIFSLLLFSFCFNLTFGVSNFFPELVLALWLELGVKETKELVRTFWGLPYGRSGVGVVGPVTLVLRFCRQIHGVETHSICFGSCSSQFLPNFIMIVMMFIVMSSISQFLELQANRCLVYQRFFGSV